MAHNTIEDRIAQIPDVQLLTAAFVVGLPVFVYAGLTVANVEMAVGMALLWIGMGVHAIVEEVRA